MCIKWIKTTHEFPINIEGANEMLIFSAQFRFMQLNMDRFKKTDISDIL